MDLKDRKNLIILVENPSRRYDAADFTDIGNRVAALNQGVKVLVVGDSVTPQQLPKEVWDRPTLTVGLGRFPFTPLRGRFLDNRKIEKLEQTRMMKAHGTATPHCALFKPGMALEQPPWSDYLILKPQPLRLTSHGNDIQIYRRSRLAAMAKTDFPPNHLVHRAAVLVQNFVDTGIYPCKWRVLMLCGEVLYAQHRRLQLPRPDLDASDAELEAAQVATSGGECNYFHDHYPDVIAFAKKAAGAFPNLPLLGLDVIKDAHDGTFSVLEVNGGGNVWHFSSRLWGERRRKMPQVALEMRTQYDAFGTAARALLAATHRLAS